ncbi:MAG: hypothetical protein K1W34_05030 [Lachnospiraceae bacterium]
MGRKSVRIRGASVPDARYRRRHREEYEMPSPQMLTRRRTAVFVEGRSR